MHLKDWFVLLTGLMALDVGLIKCLPWGDLVTRRNVQNGVPECHFIKAAFMAGLIEDVSQIALHIAFIAIIEEDDGWTITGAMASMTLSITRATVKFVFTMVLKLCATNRTHLTREHARERIPG